MDKKFLEVSQIKLRGVKEISGMRFHDIEGGFGENKKSMLVKDIANIHGRELKECNRLINNNRERFKDHIDIIDFLSESESLREFAQENGLIRSNRTQNVYLLSERGYSKLLKIMDDDLAWKKYDELVDGYFNMRGQARPLTTEEMLELQFKYTKEVKEKVERVDERVTTLEERMTIETGAQKILCDLVNKKVMAVLGGKDTPACRELGKKAFRQCWKNFKDILQVASYKDTPIKDFDLAKKVIIDWKPNRELELMIMGCNAQIRM
ncbi:ORF6C domain-containing protein [Clostridium butyricum]|uniref:ORF6C domain-containing protein n=1 Tax=Clostridium butyricum TaxID=1492 RepID=UPI002AB2CBA4|nr:ORF6C domain-containing protein [Clostridium butyricum]